MASQKTATESDVPVKQVNNILQNLRGEHFRHVRNVQGNSLSSTSLSHAHNQPTLPINLIYPSPAPTTSPSWVPGPNPPRSWRSPATSTPSSTLLPGEAKSGVNITNTTAWRERALLPLFSADVTSSSGSARSRLIYPDPGPIPQLTLLCLQLIRSTVPGTDLAEVVPYMPPHLRRALLRYTATHAPLSQTELDALCQGTTHVDTELIIVGPHNILRASLFRKTNHDDLNELDRKDNPPGESWDVVPMQDNEPLALRSLAILSSRLSAATMLAFPPTITHLALIHMPNRISLQRLPTICPLLVFLDLSYNAWLYTVQPVDRGTPMLEEVEWGKLRRLEVIGLRECPVTTKVLLGLNRGRWEDVRVIQ
ncbi:hypothetical protein JVT61DRAFT_2501 [Boletus reticuloceps]|uniref:Uncharacterized protein n=1 Tax=Boletus reticuloceps TaxID=495285 RepID=A0A8I3A973_9AGAM|nr:hypothetical protein JVT61DRAFT_2501 [Boletus reticuloceps]